MNLKSILERFFKSPFHSKSQVFLVLSLVSYTLIAFNSGWGFFGSLRAPNFISAYLFTFSLAFLFTVYIHEVNGWLNNKYHEDESPRRWTLHFAIGIFVPLAFELIAVELFFNQKGESILTNTFFDADFILVTIYILLVNAFYAYANHQLRANLKIRATYKNKIIPALKDLSVLKELHRYEVIKNAPVSLIDFNLNCLNITKAEIACAYKLDDVITIHYFDQTTEIVKDSISKLLLPLKATDYARINPYCFYHRLLVFSYEEISPSRRLYLRLRHPFNHLVHDSQRYVSQGASSNFKKWMRFNS
ncbi:hypothetical protein [Pedobacter frigiditerrae]|uniref:hypothetical protein n=1 Tax=Pedobacter frigiditerrae TaxID=2530452 RepID=UPI00292D64A5|nr:hypothetical protein [Pedobacter frigiditerrae]